MVSASVAVTLRTLVVTEVSSRILVENDPVKMGALLFLVIVIVTGAVTPDGLGGSPSSLRRT